MQARLDTTCLQASAEGIPLGMQDDEQMPDVTPIGRLDRQLDRGALQRLRVTRGQMTARLDPTFQGAKFEPQPRPSEAIHSIVESRLIVVIPLLLGVVPERTEPRSNPIIV